MIKSTGNCEFAVLRGYSKSTGKQYLIPDLQIKQFSNNEIVNQCTFFECFSINWKLFYYDLLEVC